MAESKSKDAAKHKAVLAGSAVGTAAGAAVTTAAASTIIPAAYTTFAGVTFLSSVTQGSAAALFLAANPVLLPVVGAALGSIAAYKFASRLMSDKD